MLELLRRDLVVLGLGSFVFRVWLENVSSFMKELFFRLSKLIIDLFKASPLLNELVRILTSFDSPVEFIHVDIFDSHFIKE